MANPNRGWLSVFILAILYFKAKGTNYYNPYGGKLAFLIFFLYFFVILSIFLWSNANIFSSLRNYSSSVIGGYMY